MGLLSGKAVVITGSGRGIGAACAKGVARQGASVVVNDVDPEQVDETVQAIHAEGGVAIACVADVAKWEEAGTLIESCITSFGRIDGLVNNAALFYKQRLDEFDPVVSRSLVDVNIMGTLHCSAHAVKPMLAQGSGSIINLTSDTHFGIPPYGVYAATKGAIASMVYTWALELAGSGVRVNALSPRGATRMMLMAIEDKEEARRAYEARPRAEANSHLVEFLLSDRAAGVNGQLVLVQGEEVYLYTHPALLVPPAVRSHWTADAIAEAFENEFKDRQIPCGPMAMENLPVELTGFWKPTNQTPDLPKPAS